MAIFFESEIYNPKYNSILKREYFAQTDYFFPGQSSDEHIIQKIFHIHGDKDKTIPLRNVNKAIIIKIGSHIMTLTRGEELNQLLLIIL